MREDTDFDDDLLDEEGEGTGGPDEDAIPESFRGWRETKPIEIASIVRLKRDFVGNHGLNAQLMRFRRAFVPPIPPQKLSKIASIVRLNLDFPRNHGLNVQLVRFWTVFVGEWGEKNCPKAHRLYVETVIVFAK